jgi:hypothetical protein
MLIAGENHLQGIPTRGLSFHFKQWRCKCTVERSFNPTVAIHVTNTLTIIHHHEFFQTFWKLDIFPSPGVKGGVQLKEVVTLVGP